MKFHPSIAALTFVGGLLLGLYAAEQEHATAAEYSMLALERTQASLVVCQTANAQWQAVSDVDHQVLERQAILLRKVGPIVRRAYPTWAWTEAEPMEPVR